MKLEFNYQNQVLTLPGAVLQRAESASETDLRLLLLLAASRELLEDFDPADAADRLGISEKEAELSVAFWRGAGILKGKNVKRGQREEGSCAPSQKKKEPQEPIFKKERAVLPAAVTPRDLPSYTGEEVEGLLADRGLEQLLHECQALLGKVFNVSESKKIIALFDILHLEDHYILLLCSYCKSKGKGSVPYITATACELYNSGVTTGAELEEYIAQRERTHDFTNRLRHLLGIGQRRLSAKEKRFFENWEKFCFPFEVIVFAYELSVNATTELSLPHLNAILEGFAKAGVKDLEQAEGEARAHSKEMQQLYSRKSEKKDALPEKSKEGQGAFVSFDSEEFFLAAKKRSLEKIKDKP